MLRMEPQPLRHGARVSFVKIWVFCLPYLMFCVPCAKLFGMDSRRRLAGAIRKNKGEKSWPL